jgi:hypothetical protein
VEALGRKRAEGPELLVPEGTEQPVGVVFDDGDALRRRELEDRVHLARDAGVVDGHDRLRTLGQERRETRIVDVEGVRPDVREDRLGAAQDERVGGGDEREGRNDHLVARTDPEQHRAHLERMRT